MTDAKRSQNVCHACLLRKKACDKALPACGFCNRRQLLCRYDISAPKSKGSRAYNPGRHFVPLRSPSPPNGSSQAKTVAQQLPSIESQDRPIPIHKLSLYVFPRSVDESLHRVAQYFAKLTQLTFDNIIDRYFQAFHKWLPIVSPDSFRREASRYRQEGSLPPADFTVLLLAMLLILHPARDPSLRPPRASQELLYTTTKLALSQAQTSICTSLRLVQAALLIALCEYTCVRPEAAYISMMTCAGLARVKGITINRDAQEPSHSRLEEMERENLSWSIAMLESLHLRLILCEMYQRDPRSQTVYPGPYCGLPSDLKRTAGLESKPGPNFQALNQLTSSSLDVAYPGQFERQVQSVSLLDRLLLVIRVTAENKTSKLAELAKLDGRVRSFLEVLMGELESWQTPICVHVALCVRLLFLLHESILDSLQDPKSESDQQKEQISSIALDMVCRMTLDVAQWHGEKKAQIMPICGFYNIQAARKRMEEQNKLLTDEVLSRVIEILLRAEEKYRMTWVF